MKGCANPVNSEFWSLKHSAVPQPWLPEETFWDRLNRLRRAHGLDNRDLARIANVHIVTVSAWRKRNPSTDALLALARYFNVPPERLLNGTDVLHEGGSRVEPPAD